MSEQDRFVKKFAVCKLSNCWVWTGKIHKEIGYGFFRYEGISIPAHRAAWRLFRGPIPEGKWVIHKCGNRICVNVAHLAVGSRQEHGLEIVRQNKQTHGDRNGQAKLTWDDVDNIRERAKNKERYKVLANEYGVSVGTIADVKSRRTWNVENDITGTVHGET